ncbi:bis(5'-nucleosyl)-tetraphosphatase (symmetrical) YqeK [Anaeromicropila populeti]|uniref:bis(5'-nucleosyl)-tetraphosphatase (symmetrical) n=1 Tax=Anaeromicropila populeti TaxID=37658 RepID=A0A1I6L1M1_9FIRM|nr:bis(5'-nucleosyl)-tetraphosphatase (symmetrical) YqeK [Anaeromicropila populeti]SFR97347.1 putative HD superfamily hydrolase of NAD metabolism [Anaeromicropila populeti]
MKRKLIQQIDYDMKNRLPEKRYIHTQGVAFIAAALAMRYGYNIKDAQIAGLLHDCAKYMGDEKLITICNLSGINLSDVELNNPYLLHGKVGALIAAEEYTIKDDNILNAIRYHTTGKPEMNLLEKIIFIADYIEPSRKKIPGLDEIRQSAFIDMDQTVFMILSNTISYLKDENEKEIDPVTVEALNYYTIERSK